YTALGNQPPAARLPGGVTNVMASYTSPFRPPWSGTELADDAEPAEPAEPADDAARGGVGDVGDVGDGAAADSAPSTCGGYSLPAPIRMRAPGTGPSSASHSATSPGRHARGHRAPPGRRSVRPRPLQVPRPGPHRRSERG